MNEEIKQRNTLNKAWYKKEIRENEFEDSRDKKKRFEEKLRIFKHDIRENGMTVKLEIILVKWQMP